MQKDPYTIGADGKISFGSYPQTEVKDEALRAELCAAAGALPKAKNAGNWTSYRYYIGGKPADFMWYIDLGRADGRYRGVYFTKYRPYMTHLPASEKNGQQFSNGYPSDMVYWFRFEPIVWRVLDRGDGAALLFSEKILDGMQFCHRRRAYRGDAGELIYPNNYAKSEIRAFLLGTFLQTAFDEGQRALILPTRVDNGLASTGDHANRFVCEDTEDALFLLSCSEISTEKYGFSYDSTMYYDSSRQLSATDYARAQGVEVDVYGYYSNRGKDIGLWWLRSPDYFSCRSAYCVTEIGNVYNDNEFSVTSAHAGLVPALRLRLPKP